jgi:hypothetical protein
MIHENLLPAPKSPIRKSSLLSRSQELKPHPAKLDRPKLSAEDTGKEQVLDRFRSLIAQST